MTPQPLHILSRLIAILVLAPLLGSCGGLLSDAPKRELYRVSPQYRFAVALPPVSAQLLVAVPTTPAALDTARIALSRSPESLNYFADAEWTDRVPFLVQAAIVEGFDKSGALPAVGPESGGLRADFVLETTIANFEAIYDSPNGPPRIMVRLNAKLVRMPDRNIIGQVTVNRESNAAANAVPDIVRGFEAALGGAVEELVTKTATNRALSQRRRSGISWTRFVHAGEGNGR